MAKTSTNAPNDPPSSGADGMENLEPAEESETPEAPEEPEAEAAAAPPAQQPEVLPPDHAPKMPKAPASDFPAAVETTASGLKYGWQQPPTATSPVLDVCVHMGIVQARKQLPNHAVGHQWVCTCGKLFVVILNAGGKKTFQEVESV